MTPEPLVRDLMSRNVLTCQCDTPIPQVARLMRDHDVSALVVVDSEGMMDGLISRTDLVMLRAHDEYWHGLRAEHVMVKHVICATPDTPLRDAVTLLLARKIHRLIVLEDCDKRSKPLGVLSITDIVRDMAD
ncbi:MAG: CBS domain-containing protein [Chloroflexi bacterium]|nr:CBS domain-containing protein [Chloroflexota bacterium]